MTILNYTFTLAGLKSIAITALDIFIVWLILYYVLRLVRANSRTIQIFKGVLFVIIVDGISKLAGLTTLEYFADMFINWGFLALIIIFQPEIRSILERMGKSSSVFSHSSAEPVSDKEKTVDQIMKAVMILSADKTGALISIQQKQSLKDYTETAVPLNAEVTAELLTSVFVTTTPLHDGAVIIQDEKILCASAYFPPTGQDIPGRFGARHRAALGISEITDAFTIVVSEETGNISVTEAGSLRGVTEKQLREHLMRVICGIVPKTKTTTSALLEAEGKANETAENSEPAVRRGIFSFFLKDAEENEDINEEILEELHHEADLIKLPQNHKKEKDESADSSEKPESIETAKKKIAPVEVSGPLSEGGEKDA